MIVVVMGVSGCGKSTIGVLLAEHLHVPFYDADDYHPPSNVTKMRAATPLTDEDRRPWLKTLAQEISGWNDSVPGGIHYAIALGIPSIDLHPDTADGPLPPGPGQFSVSTKVLFGVLCGPGRKHDPIGVTLPPNDFKVTSLSLHARGTIIAVGSDISFQVEAVEIVDVSPDDLESVLECILLLIIQAVLANVQIPVDKLSADFFSLVTLTDGPRIEQDQVKIFGNI